MIVACLDTFGGLVLLAAGIIIGVGVYGVIRASEAKRP